MFAIFLILLQNYEKAVHAHNYRFILEEKLTQY